MKDQFFGKLFWLTLAVVAILHAVGFFTLHTPAEAVMVVALSLATLGIASYKLEWGFLIVFAELFTTSHGHLFSVEISGFSFSLRMGIFAAVFIAWLINLILKRAALNLTDARLYPFWLLLAAIMLGAFVGLQFNSAGNVITDAKSYIYVLLAFPLMSVKWDSLKKRQLLQILAASAVWVAFFTLLILFVFTHFGENIIRTAYVFLRDARIAEVTMVEGGLYRVFLQAQFSVVVFFFILLCSIVYVWEKAKDKILVFVSLAFTAAIVLISLSRSFWVGMVAGLGTLSGFMMPTFKRQPKILGRAIFVPLGALACSLAILYTTAFFPWPHAYDISGFGNMFTDRTETGDAAGSSRWKLLPVMNEAIYASPIMGSGFGKELVYESDDPRIRELSPDGLIHSIRFEWGWHDLWLKMGIIGPISFTIVFIWIGLGLVYAAEKSNRWIIFGLFAGLVALAITHVFSPYLNHPIGLGFLVFLLPFTRVRRLQSVFETIGEKVKTPAPQASAANLSKIEE